MSHVPTRATRTETQYSTFDRRRLLLGGLVVAAAASVPVYGRYVGPESDQAPAGVNYPAIAPGYLAHATSAPNYEVAKAYSTETVPPQEFEDDCTVLVYPRSDTSEEAISGVIRSDGVEFNAPHILLQVFRYPDGYDARKDFEDLYWQAQKIAALRWMMPNADSLEVYRNQSDQKACTGLNEFGIGGCLLSFTQDNWAFVFRHTMREVIDPKYIEEVGGKILELAETFSGRALSSLTIDNWSWAYGPIDIHPSVYEAPLCSAGI